MATTRNDWIKLCRRLVRAELKRADASPAELAKRLTAMGLEESEQSIVQAIDGDVLPAWLLLAIMRALEVGTLRLE